MTAIHNKSVKTKRLRVQRFGEKSACYFADRALLVSTPYWPHEPSTSKKQCNHNGVLRKLACYSADPTLLISTR